MINKYLLAGDKFVPEMHLRQPVVTYSTCGKEYKRKNTKVQRNRRCTIYLLKWIR